jgi:hydroxyethylthiazole kinase
MVEADLSALRAAHPMVHHITNNVVTNFTANITLCLGAAPVMAPCIKESPEMVAFAGALLLNIGTLDPVQVESMLAAGHRANELGIPVVFDPVGAGATALRTGSASRLLEELEFAVIRGNAGEVLTLAGAGGKVRGVDSMESAAERENVISEFSRESGAVVAVTGETDFVTDGTRTATIGNGHRLMGAVTGTGCGASTAVACFAGAGIGAFRAACSGLAAYGIAGEIAGDRADGPGTFVPLFLDALASLDGDAIASLLDMEIV